MGVVIKHPVDETSKIKLDDFGRSEQGGQWVFNIGGSQHNNYSNGIQISVFVVIFGLIGGYLRFLYDRATVHSEHITKTFYQIDKNLDNDTSIDEKYQNLELPLSYRVKRIISTFLRLLLSKVIKINSQKINQEQEVNKKTKIMILKNQVKIREYRKIYLTESLKDLALLILSPLLAISTWFLLVQTGFQDQ